MGAPVRDFPAYSFVVAEFFDDLTPVGADGSRKRAQGCLDVLAHRPSALPIPSGTNSGGQSRVDGRLGDAVVAIRCLVPAFARAG